MTTVKADTAVYGGYSLSRNPGEAIMFIKGAIPGEVVEVEVKERKRDYSMAVVRDIVEASADRVEPLCRYFNDCGGCRLQYMSYQRQLSMKEEVMLDCLERIGGIKMELLPTLSGSDVGYRHRAQFKVSPEGEMGFYREGTREVVLVTKCPLLTDELNSFIGKLNETPLPGVKEVHVTCGEGPIALIKGKGFDEDLFETLKGIGFAGVAFDDGSYVGRGHTEFDLGGLKYTVSPWTFLQSNLALNVRAVGLLLEGLRPLEGCKVADLYAGAGNFSLPVSVEAAEVVAIEENKMAVRDGRRNAGANSLENCKFLKASAEELDHLRADIAIVDPPRQGLKGNAVSWLLEVLPRSIAYVSCNPSTLARDLKRLAEHYEVESVRVMDFFPHTYHIESLSFLRKKS